MKCDLTDTHTDRHGNYRNPRCACAPRVMKYIVGSLRGLHDGLKGTKLYALIAKVEIIVWHPGAKLCALIANLESMVWHRPGNWRAKRANLVVRCARFFLYIHILLLLL